MSQLNSYRAITRKTFAEAADRLGFVETRIKGIPDFVYEKTIKHRDVPEDRFVIRIFSSIYISTEQTREVGTDAIRVVLMDIKLKMPVKTWRVHRTHNALVHLELRVRDAWSYATSSLNRCSNCDALMIERKGMHIGRTVKLCPAELFCIKTKAA